MTELTKGRSRLVLLTMLMMALVFSACSGDDSGATEIEEAAIEATREAIQAADESPEEQAEELEQAREGLADEVEEATDADVDADADVDTEVDADAVAEADDQTVIVETQVLTDTDVLEVTEVITEATVTQLITETTILTDVVVQEDTIVTSELITETKDLGTEVSPVRVRVSGSEAEDAGYVILVLEEETGREVLADLEQRPIFAYQGEDLIDDTNFEPITTADDVSIDEMVDPSLFTNEMRDGIDQLFFNGNALYRYVGEEGQMDTLSQEMGLYRVNPAGELEIDE